MRNVSVLIGEKDNDVISEIHRLIGNHQSFEIGNIVSTPRAVLETVRATTPHIVFISTSLIDDNYDAFELCSRVVGEFPSTIVIMTSIEDDTEELRKAMRAGARDLVSLKDFNERLVDTTVDLADSSLKYEASAMDRKGKVISLLSAKGGVGKTTTAINLATDLTSRVNNEGELNRVVILDFDLQFGDISYLSDVKAKRDIADLNELPSADLDAFKGHLYENKEYGYWVLGAPKSPQYSDVIERHTLEKSITLAKKIFDFIIIDNSQGFSSTSMVAIDQSDLLIVVSSGQMVDMKNLNVMVSTLEKLLDEGFPKDRVTMLLSQYTKYCIPEKEVTSRFTINPLGVIPRDDNIVSNANNYNKSIIREYKNTDVARALTSVTDEIIRILNPLDVQFSETRGRKQSGKRGLLSTLFGK